MAPSTKDANNSYAFLDHNLIFPDSKMTNKVNPNVQWIGQRCRGSMDMSLLKQIVVKKYISSHTLTRKE